MEDSEIKQHVQEALDNREQKNAYNPSLIPGHSHTGQDSARIDFNDLKNKPASLPDPVTPAHGGTGVITLATGYVKSNGTSPFTSQSVPIPVSDGGTGAISLTGVVIGNGTSAFTTAAPLNVANGGTGSTSLTNHGVVIGQATSSVAVTSAGSAGQVLTSNGGSADPTFQAVGGSSLVQSGYDISVTTTSAKTDIFTYTVPANTLGTNKGYRVKLWIDDFNNGTNSVDFYFDYGGTFSDINIGSQNLGRQGMWECALTEAGATNAQRLSQIVMMAPNANINDTQITFGSQHAGAVKDSTSAQTLKCSIQFTAANVNDRIHIFHYTVELLN